MGVLVVTYTSDVSADRFLWQLHEELKSHLGGKFPDLDFFVDRWPEPQAVVAKVDPEGEEVGGHCAPPSPPPARVTDPENQFICLLFILLYE